MNHPARRTGGLLARRQPLWLWPSQEFWDDDSVRRVRWLLFPSAFMAGAVVGVLGGAWWVQIAAAVAAGQLVLGGVERYLRRELRRRERGASRALPPGPTADG